LQRNNVSAARNIADEQVPDERLRERDEPAMSLG
jgi:hypothetical protein